MFWFERMIVAYPCHDASAVLSVAERHRGVKVNITWVWGRSWWIAFWSLIVQQSFKVLSPEQDSFIPSVNVVDVLKFLLWRSGFESEREVWIHVSFRETFVFGEIWFREGAADVKFSCFILRRKLVLNATASASSTFCLIKQAQTPTLSFLLYTMHFPIFQGQSADG
jgi:hypothetical protein